MIGTTKKGMSIYQCLSTSQRLWPAQTTPYPSQNRQLRHWWICKFQHETKKVQNMGHENTLASLQRSSQKRFDFTGKKARTMTQTTSPIIFLPEFTSSKDLVIFNHLILQQHSSIGLKLSSQDCVRVCWIKSWFPQSQIPNHNLGPKSQAKSCVLSRTKSRLLSLLMPRYLQLQSMTCKTTIDDQEMAYGQTVKTLHGKTVKML